MRIRACRLVAVLPVLLLSSCGDIRVSEDYLADIRDHFANNTADYVRLHDMFLEDGFFRVETHLGVNWQFDDDYRRENYDAEAKWCRCTDGSGAEVPFSEVLAGLGITEERFLEYEALADKLSVRQITREGDDVVFCIRSSELFAFDYLIEIVRTQEELAGTTVSTVHEMTAYGDEDYFLPLGDDWYLHYRNYDEEFEPRPRHPNGPPPFSG